MLTLVFSPGGRFLALFPAVKKMYSRPKTARASKKILIMAVFSGKIKREKSCLYDYERSQFFFK
jgi:hypothetical protein